MNSDLSDVLKYSDEVAAAIASGSPIVALESTIISHGLPRPTNLEVAREVEAIVATLQLLWPLERALQQLLQQLRT
jgi:pseudouridine-5'-phosphate glycosidase